jgi:hypothetical protein
MANEYHVTTIAAEALHTGVSAAQVASIGVEVLRSAADSPTGAQVMSIGVEVLRSVTNANARRRQFVNS